MAAAVEFTWQQKVYIVRAFAALRTVPDILADVSFNYGVKCRPDDLLQFDPEYRVLPPDLDQVYRQEKDRFDKDPAQVIPLLSPVKQEAALANSAKAELRRGAVAEAAKLLEQLAKLQSGFYAGKAKPSATTPVAEQIEEIRVTYVDPKAPA